MEQPQFNQQALEGEGFNVSKAFILENTETVTDFFGDNRHWYAKLLTSGQKYSKVSLDGNEINEDPHGNGEAEILPLDPKRITEGRAENIVNFFEEWKEAKEDFTEYYKHEKQEKSAV
jgi:hypothetical protein